MGPENSLITKARWELIGNMAQGIPDNFSEKEIEDWNNTAGQLRKSINSILTMEDSVRSKPLWVDSTIILAEILPEDDTSFSEKKCLKIVGEESIKESDGRIFIVHTSVSGKCKRSVRGEFLQGKDFFELEKKSENRAGLRSCRALLRQQHKIPVEWQDKGKSIVFTGTVIRNSEDDKFFPSLYWSGNEWEHYPVFFEQIVIRAESHFPIRCLDLESI